MLEPKRTESNVRPSKVENLKNGYWFYNYDIRVSENNPESNLSSDTEKYDYIQVRIEGEPTYSKCVEQVIRAFVSQSQEFDLINSYNRAMFNMLSEEGAEKAGNDYVDYLAAVSTIKDKVREDFE